MKTILLTMILSFIHLAIHSQETGTLTDPRDGKVYKTVKIGDKWVMAENLAYKPENGLCWDESTIISDTGLDTTTIKKYFEIFGYLYDYKTANTIAIPGWHVPSRDEWKELFESLGGSPKKVYTATIQGGSSGFNALFSGMGIIDLNGRKGVIMINQTVGFWSSDKFALKGLSVGYTPPATRFNSGAVRIGLPGYPGLNVRLFKDN